MPKNFFLRPGGADTPNAPPGYAYAASIHDAGPPVAKKTFLSVILSPASSGNAGRVTDVIVR